MEAPDREGSSLSSVQEFPTRQSREAVQAKLGHLLQLRGHPACSSPPEFRERLEHDAKNNGEGYKAAPIMEILGITDAEDLEWVRERLCPSPIGVFRQPVEAPTFAWQIPSTYILCTGFGFRPTAERCREAGWPVLEIDCGHDAMIIKPRELAELLTSVPRAPET